MKDAVLKEFADMQTRYFAELALERIKEDPNEKDMLASQTIIDTLTWAIGVVKRVAATSKGTSDPVGTDENEKADEAKNDSKTTKGK